MGLPRHIITVALRNLAVSKLISAISIFGLAVGIAAALLMAAVVRNQLSFDHFIPGHERTYIALGRDNPKLNAKLAPCPVIPYCLRGDPSLAPKLKLAAPEIEAIARLAYTRGANGDEPLKLQAGTVVGEEMLYWADPGVFDVLPLPVMYGDLVSALARPDGIVLPQAVARKYFGHEDVVGNTLAVGGHPMIVRAVIHDLPDNGTTLMSGIFVAGSADFSPIAPNGPGGPVYTYLRLRQGASVNAVQDRITAVLDSMLPPQFPRGLSVGVLLRLDRANLDEINNPGIHDRLAAAALAGLILLLIALVNFVNLMSTRSGRRAKDVMIRKVCGASRTALITQFLAEAMLSVIFATILALAAGELVLPEINAFLRTGARLNDPLLPLLLVSVLCAGLAAGAWPAFVLSALRPARTLQGWSSGNGAPIIRSALVGLQFTMLMILALAAVVVWQQRNYATHEALKADTDQVLLIRTSPQGSGSPPADMQAPNACPFAFLERVRRLSGVRDVRCTDQSFIQANNNISWFKNSMVRSIDVNQVDPGIFRLYQIKPLAGALSDTSGAIINLSAVKFLGFSSPQAAIGQSWFDGPAKEMPPDFRKTWTPRYGGHSRIAAVVPDFAFTPVTDEIKPAVFSSWIRGQRQRAIHVKLSNSHLPETLGAIDQAWSASGQSGAINRVFLTDYIAQLYQDMLREAQFFTAFAMIAILLACLGLIGIAITTAERRTKEIGVRKAMGADSRQIVTLLLWQFAQPVLWSNVVAWPVAWWLMRYWLSGFAYHIELEWWIFGAISLGVLLIGLLAVAGQAIFTARQKAALALRYE